MQVLLDTNILRANPGRDKGDFQALENLAISNHVDVYIPYYVKQEFLTARVETYKEEIKKILGGAKGIKRKGPIPFFEDLIKDIEDLSSEDYEEILKEYLEDDFNSWVDKINAEVLEVKDSHSERVTNDYFEGNVPFAKIKSRNDIPDSFIWQNILDLLDKVKELNVISNDRGIYEPCEDHDSIKPFKELVNFIELDQCQEKLKEGLKTVNINLIEEGIPRNSTYIRDLISDKLPDELIHSEIEADYIPSDDHRGFIFSIGETEDVGVNFDIIYNGGEGIFMMPFNATIGTEINYALFKGDLYNLEDNRIEEIYFDERNDHYYDINELINIKLDGIIVVQIDDASIEEEKMAKGEIDRVINECDLKIDSYEIDEINKS